VGHSTTRTKAPEVLGIKVVTLHNLEEAQLISQERVLGLQVLGLQVLGLQVLGLQVSLHPNHQHNHLFLLNHLLNHRHNHQLSLRLNQPKENQLEVKVETKVGAVVTKGAVGNQLESLRL